MIWTVVGSIAATLTTLGFVPQVLKMYRTRSVKDVSVGTFLQFLAGVSLWTMFGVHLGDPVIIAANAVMLAILIIALSLYVWLASRPEPVAPAQLPAAPSPEPGLP